MRRAFLQDSLRGQQQAEKQRLASKAQRAAEKRKAKQTASFRHLLLSETLKRVKPPLGNEQMRLVARFVLASLPHEQVLRLGKRHGLQAQKGQVVWQVAEKARGLYKTAGAGELARLVFEAVLVGSAANVHPDKGNDILTDAAAVYQVDTNAIRTTVENNEKRRTKKNGKPETKNASRKQQLAAKR